MIASINWYSSRIPGSAAGVLAIALLNTLSLAQAQTAYPSKPIRLIVTQAAGSVPDILGRVLAEHMSRDLGRPITVDNRAGADGIVGMEVAAKSAADGYNLVLGTQSTLAIEPLLRKDIPYDATRDFSPIAVIVDDTGGQGWFVNAALPIRTLPDMAAYARANPGKLTLATNTSSAVMFAEWVKKRAGIDFLIVPYKSGPQGVQDTVSGTVAMMISSTSALEPFVKTGQVRGLAVSSPRRLEDWKDLPTVAETFPDFGMASWVVLVAPAGVAADIIQRLNRSAASALRQPQYIQQVRKLRWINVEGPRTPQETGDFIRAGREQWGQVLKAIGQITG
jgi:tripartite-type tricarboxylate transporter receptor subunit TctC